jgi:catechol 2,3-dioxygenase-like lactoylglutathione lyase family enzyme
MTVKAGYSTPMLHVADIERSLRFYALLGFETVDVEKTDGRIFWARMHCEGGALMFLGAEEDHPPGHDRFLLYLYTPDLASLRNDLTASGIEIPPIAHPDYMPSGEICLKDPDGYTILVAHWSEKEHTEWLKQIEGKRREGIIP